VCPVPPEPADTSSKAARLQDKITILKEQMQYLKEVEKRFSKTAWQHVCCVNRKLSAARR